MGSLNRLRTPYRWSPRSWLAASIAAALLLGLAGPLLLRLSTRILLLAVAAGLVATAGMWALRWKLSLYSVLATLIVVGILSTYLLFATQIGPLNLRPHQLLLPAALLSLLGAGAFDRADRSRVWLAAAGMMLWGATLFWTMVNLGELQSAVLSLGRVGLLALNLITALSVYLLVVRTGAWREATRTLINSVVAFNLVVIVLAGLAVLGVTQIESWVAVDDQEPALIAGQVVAGTTFRFAGGVVNGIVAVVVLVLILVQWVHASSRRRWGFWPARWRARGSL